jgi:hypothetical protein
VSLLSTFVRYTAKWTGLVINIAIGLQVFFGALTTGLGAALGGKSVRGVNATLLRDLPDIFSSHLLQYQYSVVRQRLWRHTWRGHGARMSQNFLCFVQRRSIIFCVRSTHSPWTMGMR